MSVHGHTDPPVDVAAVLREIRLARAMIAPTTDELVVAAVKVARTAGLSWEAIGEVLGVSGPTAHAQFGFLEPPEVHGLVG